MRNPPEDIYNLKEKILAHKKRLYVGAIIFLLIVSIIVGFYFYNYKKAREAKYLEYEAYKAFFQQKFPLAGDLFRQAYEKKKNISYLLQAGYAYASAGQTEKAIECLSKIASMDDEAFSNLAKFKMAMIYLKNNEKATAVKTLKEILDGRSATIKDIALYELAKISAETNKTEAQKYFQEIIDKYPSSPLVDYAKTELKKLQTN